MSHISWRKLFWWWKMLSLFSTKVRPNIKKTPGELLKAFWPSLELSKVLIKLYPALAKLRFSSFYYHCHYKSTKQLTHSILMKFCFDGMKKLRRRFMNLVFFIVSSNLDGVKRFPSSISLITCLCDDVLYYYYLISLPVPLPEVLLLEDPTVS